MSAFERTLKQRIVSYRIVSFGDRRITDAQQLGDIIDAAQSAAAAASVQSPSPACRINYCRCVEQHSSR